ncbi:MAG: diacylglycerol kinase family protein [Bacteroidota bacterium]
MPYTFILNPAAAHGRAGRLHGRLHELAERLGVAHEVKLTTHPGHATTLAREAAQPGQRVVAVGGDGTIQEVAAGLAGTRAVLGVVPIGTGNDFARSLGLPTKLDEAARMLPVLQPRATDLGRIAWTNDDGTEHERSFVNAVGIGFDARVAVLAEGYKQFPGQAAYLAGVFKGLRSWTNPRVHITTATHATVPAGADEDVPADPSWFDGPIFLLAIGNGWSVGGGFRLTPEAQPDDGHLDLCLLRGITAGRALQLLPRAMRGKHTTAEEVALDRVASVTLDSESPLPVHADGEILTTRALRLTTTIEPGALSVLRP